MVSKYFIIVAHNGTDSRNFYIYLVLIVYVILLQEKR